jgi:hypothetical protein
LARFTRLEEREFHEIEVSVNFPSLTKLNTTAGSKDSSQHFADVRILQLLELWTDLISIPISFLSDLKLEMSSELSSPAGKTGGNCREGIFLIR